MAVIRVGPSRLDPVEDDDVGERRGEQPRVGDGEDDRGSAWPACSGAQIAPGRRSWPMPIGARTSVPPIVAQVVSHERRVAAQDAAPPNAV